MRDETVTIETPDGPMDAYVTSPEGPGPHAAVVVVQEAFGVNHHIRSVCRRFSEAGYVALAPELFHRAGRGLEIDYGDMAPAMQALGSLTNEGIEFDLAAALGQVRKRPDVAPGRVGLVGFCVGGFAAFLAACRLDPAVTVSFYGGGIVRKRPQFSLEPVLPESTRIAAPILCIFGAEDKGIPPEDVDAIRQTLDRLAVAHEVISYPGAGHAFFCDARSAYAPEPAARAWRRTLEWLELALRRPAD